MPALNFARCRGDYQHVAFSPLALLVAAAPHAPAEGGRVRMLGFEVGHFLVAALYALCLCSKRLVHFDLPEHSEVKI